MSNQNPGTQPNRDNQKARPQQGGHGQDQDESQKQGSKKDPSGGNNLNPGSDSDRARKPGQKSGQS
jgi:hypothetical protein